VSTRRRKRRQSSGGILDEAFARWRRVRADFDDHLEAQIGLAEHACRGILLNTRGRAAGIDPRTLFYGPRSRVDCYASEELRDWFHEHGRTTFEQFERHHPEGTS
jgi:hypothetical protein